MPDAVRGRPLVIGLGGTMRPGSSSERALRLALDYSARAGARTDLFVASDLDIPMYVPGGTHRDERSARLVDTIAAADGLIISSPAYHGGMSGLVKNALDYVEDLREDVRPYLDGRAVGCIVCANGWQATATTLVSLRSVVHALRGWPTPLGVVTNPSQLGLDGPPPETGTQLSTLATQVVDFARRQVTQSTSTMCPSSTAAYNIG